jgi:hypothetical protein
VRSSRANIKSGHLGVGASVNVTAVPPKSKRSPFLTTRNCARSFPSGDFQLAINASFDNELFGFNAC